MKAYPQLTSSPFQQTVLLVLVLMARLVKEPISFGMNCFCLVSLMTGSSLLDWQKIKIRDNWKNNEYLEKGNACDILEEVRQ